MPVNGIVFRPSNILRRPLGVQFHGRLIGVRHEFHFDLSIRTPRDNPRSASVPTSVIRYSLSATTGTDSHIACTNWQRADQRQCRTDKDHVLDQSQWHGHDFTLGDVAYLLFRSTRTAANFRFLPSVIRFNALSATTVIDSQRESPAPNWQRAENQRHGTDKKPSNCCGYGHISSLT